MSGTWIENDPTTVDYLGREAPLTLADRPALPTGEAFTLATAPPTSSGGGTTPPGGSAPAGPGALRGPTGAPSQAALSRFLSMVTGGPAPLPEGQKPGGAIETGPAGAVMTAPPSDGTDAALAASDGEGLLASILQAGGTVEKILKNIAEAAAQRGGSDFTSGLAFTETGDVLSPRDFSLDGEPGEALAPADFTLDAGTLNAIMPDLLRLRGSFDEGGAILNPSNFDLSGAEGGSVLNPGDFSLLPGQIDPSVLDRILGTVGSAVPIASILGNAALGALNSNDPMGSIAKSVGLAMPMIGGVAAGLSLADAASAASGGAVGALWNIPQMAMALYTLINGGEHDSKEAQIRRFKRTRDAGQLQGEILRPLFEARTSDDFVNALAAPVTGGSNVGDALANILWNNIQGTWYADTAHQWLPDLSLLPLLTVLQNLGYTGQTEPHLRNVGGVGEIVQGGGRFLPPDPRFEGRPTLMDAGGGEGMIEGPDYAQGSRGGSVGWDRALRDLTEAITGQPITAPEPFTSRTGYGTLDFSSPFGPVAPTERYDIARYGDMSAMDPETRARAEADVASHNQAADYLSALQGFSPDAFATITNAIRNEPIYGMEGNFNTGG